ncbi:MAG: substrate-binding domain-containing protein [Chloroflexota bacterium]|nr:substrate-binding domain-containing protein [Chloroflexota bacterium]
MVNVRLDYHSSTPLYQQIADQVRQLIATNEVKRGEHLPTVRQLAGSLDVNYNTVVRAYMVLEQERIIVARRGGGTVVAAETDDPTLRTMRRKRLADMVSDDIVKALSLGYSPEELEAAFSLHLARWREERQASAREPQETLDNGTAKKVIRIVGSHDLAVNLMVTLLRHRGDGVEAEVTDAGSLGGLIALQEERADLAGIHLLDEETGDYNYPFVKRILPGREIAVVHLAYRIQGLMFAAGNPKQIEGLADLRRAGVRFVNRQKGSGTRVLLDIKLKQDGIPASQIDGYERETDTHLAVASAIVHGEADVGLGIEAAARSCGLGLLPLFRERYDLVMPMANYRSDLLSPLLEVVASDRFRKLVNEVGGYDTSQTGATTFL